MGCFLTGARFRSASRLKADDRRLAPRERFVNGPSFAWNNHVRPALVPDLKFGRIKADAQ